MRTIYVDGSGWNGVNSYYAVKVLSDKGQVLETITERFSVQKTNNEMEYSAVIRGLEIAENGDTVFTDSALVYNQLFSNWRINYDYLRLLNDKAKAILATKRVLVELISGKANLAHYLTKR